VDGEAVAEYDYTWHADPSEDHGEVKNSPAEYYTGTEPGDETVYIAHDIYYYPELDVSGFQKVTYDDDQEWAYYYTAEGYTDYIFSTLPVSGSGVPTSMMHSEAEAYENAVLHITQAGTYEIEGQWHGQIWIDLGDTDDTFSDESAKVTVILNGVDVTCTVAPALVFYSVYECDNTWEDQSAWSAQVDTSNAGANVILADGTTNNFTGENVYRILKTKFKDDDEQSGRGVKLQKKRLKQDGAFYSYVTMNIDGGEVGTGVLNIHAGYEGLDSELHLSLNGGNVNIYSQDDGINVNEDGVSVVTVNGGALHILAGLGSEGDGIDSNGYLVINGGTVISMANPGSDSGLDSDRGSYINGGTVVALGSTMDWAEADDSNSSGQVTMNLQFANAQNADEAIIVTDTDGNVVFAYDPDKDEVAGSDVRWYQGAILSFPTLQVGKSYYVYVGGDVTGSETAGIYDVSTVTGFTDDAKQQCYTGTDVGFGGPGGGFGRGDRPDGDMPQGGFNPDDLPEDFDPDQKGDGFDPDQMGGKFDPSQMENFDPGQMGGDFDPSQTEGFDPSQMGGDFDPDNAPAIPDQGQGDREPMQRPEDMTQGGNSGTASTLFTMADQVNGFSGVTDYTGDIPAETPSTPAQAPSTSATGFTDVTPGIWYESAVQYVSTSGLMTGTSNSTFSPIGTTTRGTLMTILARLDGVDTSSSSPWYQAGMDWAVQANVSDGASPETDITREQIVTMLWRYMGEPASDQSLSAYTDSGSVSSWAQSAMQWAVETGLVTGANNALTPTATATRAELATMLTRLCESLSK
jgi:hypothetical protein